MMIIAIGSVYVSHVQQQIWQFVCVSFIGQYVDDNYEEDNYDRQRWEAILLSRPVIAQEHDVVGAYDTKKWKLP